MIFHRNGTCTEIQLHGLEFVLIREMLNFINYSECWLIPSADASVLRKHLQIDAPFLI